MFKCEYCGKKFKVKRGLKNHIDKFHPEKVKYNFKCEICQKGFNELPRLLTHIIKVHKEVNLKEYYNENLYGKIKCKYCGKLLPFERYSGEFCNQQHYESYKRKDEIKFKCEICKAGFKDKGGLQQHLGKMHKEVNQEEYYRKYLITESEPDGKCLWCGEEVNFDSFTNGYNKFCFNKDCNVRWYNKNSDRKEKAAKSLSEIYKNDKSLLPQNVEYWIKKGFNEEEATQKVKERQTTFSKEICIKKYGKKEGLKRWQARQDKWQETLNSKSDEEIREINKRKIPRNPSSITISVVEYRLRNTLNVQPLVLQREDILSHYVYDLCKGNKIIEYNGDYWHCNPIKYLPDYYNSRLKMKAKEKWKKDKEKIDFAKSKGYDVKVIWEKDYKDNPNKVIKECLEFLND